jgi:hypothetical protein
VTPPLLKVMGGDRMSFDRVGGVMTGGLEMVQLDYKPIRIMEVRV